MRGRLIFIVLAVLVVAGIAALNWQQFTSPTSMNFGIVRADLPLGLVMLTLLGIVLAVFLVSAGVQESRYLLEHRRHARALQAQRELAEKAEASRFTDLRQHLDTHLRETRQRESIAATEFDRTVMQGQREIFAKLEQMHHMLAARLSDLEAKLGPLEVRPTAVRDARDVDVVRDVRPGDVRGDVRDVRDAGDLRADTLPPDLPPRDRVRM